MALMGRVLSGTGSVLLVVAAPKMTMDLFAGPRLPAAMGALMSAYPLGGWALGRSGKPVRGIGLCLIAMTLAYRALPGGIASAVCLLVVGAMVGLCAGPIMALPGEVLAPQHRALGMGFFYAIYYGGMTVLPPLAGRAGDATGSAAAPLVAAALFSLLSVLSLLAYAGARRRD